MLIWLYDAHDNLSMRTMPHGWHVQNCGRGCLDTWTRRRQHSHAADFFTVSPISTCLWVYFASRRLFVKVIHRKNLCDLLQWRTLCVNISWKVCNNTFTFGSTPLVGFPRRNNLFQETEQELCIPFNQSADLLCQMLKSEMVIDR
jgi:hypothetical protein